MKQPKFILILIFLFSIIACWDSDTDTSNNPPPPPPDFENTIKGINFLKKLIELTVKTNSSILSSNQKLIKSKTMQLVQDSESPEDDMKFIYENYDNFSDLFGSANELNSFLKNKMEDDKRYLNKDLADKIGVNYNELFKKHNNKGKKPGDEDEDEDDDEDEKISVSIKPILTNVGNIYTLKLHHQGKEVFKNEIKMVNSSLPLKPIQNISVTYDNSELKIESNLQKEGYQELQKQIKSKDSKAGIIKLFYDPIKISDLIIEELDDRTTHIETKKINVNIQPILTLKDGKYKLILQNVDNNNTFIETEFNPKNKFVIGGLFFLKLEKNVPVIELIKSNQDKFNTNDLLGLDGGKVGDLTIKTKISTDPKIFYEKEAFKTVNLISLKDESKIDLKVKITPLDVDFKKIKLEVTETSDKLENKFFTQEIPINDMSERLLTLEDGKFALKHGFGKKIFNIHTKKDFFFDLCQDEKKIEKVDFTSSIVKQINLALLSDISDDVSMTLMYCMYNFFIYEDAKSIDSFSISKEKIENQSYTKNLALVKTEPNKDDFILEVYDKKKHKNFIPKLYEFKTQHGVLKINFYCDLEQIVPKAISFKDYSKRDLKIYNYKSKKYLIPKKSNNFIINKNEKDKNKAGKKRQFSHSSGKDVYIFISDLGKTHLYTENEYNENQEYLLFPLEVSKLKMISINNFNFHYDPRLISKIIIREKE